MDAQDITERLVRIETKVDMLVEARSDHESRLRSLSREMWLHRGGVGVVTFLLMKLGLPLTWTHG